MQQPSEQERKKRIERDNAMLYQSIRDRLAGQFPDTDHLRRAVIADIASSLAIRELTRREQEHQEELRVAKNEDAAETLRIIESMQRHHAEEIRKAKEETATEKIAWFNRLDNYAHKVGWSVGDSPEASNNLNKLRVALRIALAGWTEDEAIRWGASGEIPDRFLTPSSPPQEGDLVCAYCGHDIGFHTKARKYTPCLKKLYFEGRKREEQDRCDCKDFVPPQEAA